MTSPHLLAPPTAIITFSLMLSVPVNVSAQTEEAPSIDSPEQCALIDDGIKRLACFDSLYKPTESQAQAQGLQTQVQNMVPWKPLSRV